jgi:hypothetical protein
VPAEVDEVIHGTEVEKFHLPESSRRALVEAYADDVADLSRLVPDLDLALWPSFAQPQAAAFEQADAGKAPSAVRLHLGSGRRPREGWVNVDADPALEPDLVARAESLTTVADATVEAVEACHLFEHFTYPEALAALREWHRVLRPGGTLELELPNLDACVHMLGRNVDAGGYDFGMIGIYGYPPAIADAGAFQAHKWGWTPETLGAAMRDAGFADVQQVPIEQTWRPAAAFDRDMRMRARRPVGARSAGPDFVGVGA